MPYAPQGVKGFYDDDDDGHRHHFFNQHSAIPLSRSTERKFIFHCRNF
jgi:hypothetical protein